MSQNLYELLDINAVNPPEFVSLMITFAEKNPDPSNHSEAEGAGAEKILENVPEVRVYFDVDIGQGLEENEPSPLPTAADPKKKPFFGKPLDMTKASSAKDPTSNNTIEPKGSKAKPSDDS